MPANGIADHATMKSVAHFVSHYSAGVTLEPPICNRIGGANGGNVFGRDSKLARGQRGRRNETAFLRFTMSDGNSSVSFHVSAQRGSCTRNHLFRSAAKAHRPKIERGGAGKDMQLHLVRGRDNTDRCVARNIHPTERSIQRELVIIACE